MIPIIIFSAQGRGSDKQAQMVKRWGQRRRSKHFVCLIKCAWALTSLHHSVCLLVRKAQKHLLVGLFSCNIHIRHSATLLQERAAIGASNISHRNWISSLFCSHSCCLLLAVSLPFLGDCLTCCCLGDKFYHSFVRAAVLAWSWSKLSLKEIVAV